MHTYEHAYTPYTHLIYSRFSIVQNFIILTYIIIILNFLISQISITLLQFTTITYKHCTQWDSNSFTIWSLSKSSRTLISIHWVWNCILIIVAVLSILQCFDSLSFQQECSNLLQKTTASVQFGLYTFSQPMYSEIFFIFWVL
jgi:uncharacterized membrane protein